MEIRKAYFHLPGLFEFYELYRVFLPLYRTHRDWFYDWCEIGSLYGAPADCLWGGGRTGCSRHTAREVLALAQEYGISARLTFSNSLLREEHLTDPKCNALCAQFAQGSVQNGVIVHSDLLVDYLQEHYPELYLVSSTTKVLTEFTQLEAETARPEFRYVVPDFRLNKAFAQLDSLPQTGIDLAEQMPAAQLRQNILPPPVILAQDMHAAGNDKTSCRYLLAQLPDKAVPGIDPQLRIQILQHCRDLCFRNTAEQRCRRYDLQIFIHSSLPPL